MKRKSTLDKHHWYFFNRFCLPILLSALYKTKTNRAKKHTGLVSEDFPVQDIKHQSKNIYEDAYQTEADNQLQKYEKQ